MEKNKNKCIKKNLPTYNKLFRKKNLGIHGNEILLNVYMFFKLLFFENKLDSGGRRLNKTFFKKCSAAWHFFFWKSITFWYLSQEKKLNLKKVCKKNMENFNLNLSPLISLDNNIIPLWLRKLKGLEEEYKCDLCNGKYFRGFASFYQHFYKSSHLRSLKRYQLFKKDQNILKGIHKKEDIMKILKNKGGEKFSFTG